MQKLFLNSIEKKDKTKLSFRKKIKNRVFKKERTLFVMNFVLDKKNGISALNLKSISGAI